MSSYCCAGMFGKRTLLLLVSSVLVASLAWAEAPAPSGGLFADSGGRCRLPDLTGLSPEQIAAAGLAAGLQAAPTEAAQNPPCPATFDCSSIFGCGAITPCTVELIGPCCKPAHGPTLCCDGGNIQVTRCPCDCIDPRCQLFCLTSTDVKLSC